MGNNQTQGIKEANSKFEELFKSQNPDVAVKGLQELIESGKLTDQVLAGLPIEGTACQSKENTMITMLLVTSVGLA